MGGSGALVSEDEITLPKVRSISCEDAAHDVDYGSSALQHNSTGAQSVAQRKAEEGGKQNVGQKEEWRPAGVHVGDTCTAMPAPHASDGGVERPRIGVAVVDESELWKGSVSKSREVVSADARKRYVRLPSVRARRKARDEERVHAFGVRGPTGSYVCLQKDSIAVDDNGGHDVKLFDAWTTLAKNIREASKWAAKVSAGVRPVSVHICKKERSERARHEHIQWDSKASSFVPSCCTEATSARSGGTTRTEVPVVDQATTQDDIQRLHLRELLKHKQVSHVRHAVRDVRTKMDAFNTCSHGKMQLDLRGTTAKQIQKDLRAQLVEDLMEGSDEAAFVCKQLGIDSVPRADQLELMIAAMPGRAKLVFEGPVAKSGLNLHEWRAGHATHCKKGCTASKIDDECYFRVVHHFLLRGYEPALNPGETWDQFKKQYPAYVDVWREDEDRCRKAWEKWKENSADLLSEPVEEEPRFSVPILPATRSKHRWRFLHHGIPYKVRLCLDLKASKVNGATGDWKFRYRGLDDIAANLQHGDWLASVDISRFYLRLPAGPNLRSVQWVQDPDSYAFTAKLNNRSKRRTWRQLQAIGFGLKTAPAWASVVSAELVRILKAAGVRVIGCFIDDLLIAGRTQLECQQALDKAIHTMRRLGIPANEKTVQPQSPNEGIVFLGFTSGHLICDSRYPRSTGSTLLTEWGRR